MVVCHDFSDYYKSNQLFGRHIYTFDGRNYRHGIVVENGYIIASVPVSNPQQMFQAQTLMIPWPQFTNGCQIDLPDYSFNYDRYAARDRAVSSLRTIDNYSHNLNGDNFTFMCLTGFYPQPDSHIFGQHLVTRRGVIYHHGIGIEDGYVVHTNIQQGEVHVVSFDEFACDEKVEIINYQNTRRFDLLQTRNRAINCLGMSGYDLIDNNCEHLATWCTTGVSRSIQVENASKFVVGSLAITGGLLFLGWLIDEMDR